MQKVFNPVPIYLNVTGGLLSGGKIYVGVANQDPETDPVQVYWDSDLTEPATQPLRTVGGLIVNGFTPASIFIAEDDYSMRVTEDNDTVVFYEPSVYASTDSFQAHSAQLDAIAALSTTAFGRSLLTMANSAALAAATGIPAPLPATGGTITGDIVRGSAGAHFFWNDPALGKARCFLTANGASNPMSNNGELWFEKAP